MLIIPELKKVVIQPPRTASTSLREAVLARYPKAISLYRHMEWAGVPQGYDSYTPVYVSRTPVLRLNSLWRYMRSLSEVTCPNAPKEWIDRQNKDADRPFWEWVKFSTELFNDGDTSPDGAYYKTYKKVPAARKGFWDFMSDKNGLYPQYMEVVSHRDTFRAFDLSERHLNSAPLHCQGISNQMIDAVMSRHKVDQMVHDRVAIPQQTKLGSGPTIVYL